MKVIRTVAELRKWRISTSLDIGFVPTMGALHEGHESLLKKARAENSQLVSSLFVNPTQFNNPEDFEKYPSSLEQDLEILRKNKVDVLFLPNQTELYPDNYKYRVQETEFSRLLCGAHRPGHFDGVLSVVLKLFQLVKPSKAYFGEKDFQQLLLIEGMVQAFFLDIEIIRCPTLRESDSLAMSSRNRRLSPKGRERAALLPKIAFNWNLSTQQVFQDLTDQGFRVDYVEDRLGRRFVAAEIEGIRLIDNKEIQS